MVIVVEPNVVFKQHVRKPGDYLHYWYSNVDSGILRNNFRIINMSKTKILQNQIRIFQQRQLAATGGAFSSNLEMMQKVGEVFDASVYQEGLDRILQPSLDGNVISNIPSSSYTLENLATLSSMISSDNIVSRLSDFSNAVKGMIQERFSPAGNVKDVEAIGKELLNKYAYEAGITKRPVGPNSSLTAKQLGRTANHIIRSVLSRSNQKMFQVNKTDDANLTNTYKKFLLIAQALDNFEGGGETGPVRAAVRHGGSSKTSWTNSKNEVLSELASKVYNAGKWMQRIGLEEAFRIAGLEANGDFLKDKLSLDESIKTENIGNRQFDVSVRVKEDPVLQRIYNEAKANIDKLTKQVAKGDVKLTVTKNGIVIDLGFSVKSGDQLNVINVNGLQNANITLQNRTPLVALIAREANMGQDSLLGVLQLLVAHGNEEVLDANWEMMKENIWYNALLSLLSGSTLGGQALFMVIGNKVVSIGTILERVMENQNNIYSLTARVRNQNEGSLDRAHYMSLNKWIEPTDAPKVQQALIRSDITWQTASKLFYNTKVSVDLNIRDLSNLFI